MAYLLGYLIGLGILVAVIVGLVRTFTRKDLTWKEKLVGSKR